MTIKRRDDCVFINVPFDETYENLLRALIFTISACGYEVRCALEEDDSGNIRMDKLDRLLRESGRSIHDLSRTELNDLELPRFNMPFELGMAIGIKRFGRSRRNDQIKIMVAKPYALPAYLSDLGGVDPSAHQSKPEKVIEIVRDFLQHPPGRPRDQLPGPRKLVRRFRDFEQRLPRIAQEIDFDPDEVGALVRYRTFVWCVTEYLTNA